MNSVDKVLRDIRTGFEPSTSIAKLLCTIGNQSSYLCSAYTLAADKTVRMYEGQRALVDSRVKELVAHQVAYYEAHKTYAFRGAILMCRTQDSETLWIIDGQHRYVTILSLVDEGVPDFYVRFDLLVVGSTAEILREFQDINRSVPVPICYLNPNDVVNAASRLIEAKFPKCFGKGKVSRPKMDVESFKSHLIKANVATIHNLDQHKLFNSICRLNDYYKSISDADLLDRLGRKNKQERLTLESCLAKCRTGDYLFMGLFKSDNSEWMNQLEKIFS
jgi:hypothetical protein